MMIIREFLSNFIKIRRTPVLLLHTVLPVVVTALFLAYYAFAGYHIIPDERLFFVILQICYPIFVSIAVPMLIQLDKNVKGIQNALGLVESRRSVFLGKLFFLLFLSAISMILYELCFFVGANCFMESRRTHFNSYLVIFFVFLISNLFLYRLHILLAFRFGSSISVLAGICGTISAGFFENAIGDKIWPFIPCGTVYLQGGMGDAGWQIIVRDEGPGFSKAALQHAAERLWRGDAARSTDGHNGLGLWFAAEVVKTHAGQMELCNCKTGGVVIIKFC